MAQKTTNAGGEPGGHERPVESERAGTRWAFGKHRGHQRQRGGSDHRSGDALTDPSRDQQRGLLGEAAGEGGEAEQDDPDEEEPLASEQVDDAAEEQGEACGAQCERGHDPLQVRGGEPEFVADVRQGNVQDGEVDREGEVRRQQDSQGGLLQRGEPFGSGG